MVVIRYCACTNKPEHSALRDTCLHWIGNPWLKRTAWDAHVNDEPSRQMVDGWLKRRLIQDFFELLAHDGGADLRRLNYWLKWAPQITDMWFVLGSDARSNRSAAFMDLRKRMLGRDRVLNDHNHLNNAFVMRIGPLLVIEFGITGNACYAFAAADFSTSLEKPAFRIHELKQRSLAKRLSHMSSWEGDFDYELARLLQSVPMSKGDLKAPELVSAARPERQISAKNPATWTDFWRSTESPESHQLLSEFRSKKVSGSPLAPASAPKQQSQEPASVALHTAQTLIRKTHSIEAQPKLHSSQEANTSLSVLLQSPSQVPPAPIKKRAFTNLEFINLRTMCQRHKIEWEDNRPKKGALWVLLPNRKKVPSMSLILEKYGFHYAEGKGFWLKDEV